MCASFRRLLAEIYSGCGIRFHNLGAIMLPAATEWRGFGSNFRKLSLLKMIARRSREETIDTHAPWWWIWNLFKPIICGSIFSKKRYVIWAGIYMTMDTASTLRDDLAPNSISCQRVSQPHSDNALHNHCWPAKDFVAWSSSTKQNFCLCKPNSHFVLAMHSTVMSGMH